MYVANLLVSAHLIYPLYRLRWQIELVFKAFKSCLRLADLPSANSEIIHVLVYAALIANMIAHPIAHYLMLEFKNEKLITPFTDPKEGAFRSKLEEARVGNRADNSLGAKLCLKYRSPMLVCYIWEETRNASHLTFNFISSIACGYFVWKGINRGSVNDISCKTNQYFD